MNLISRMAGALGFERRAKGGDPYWDNMAALRSGPVNEKTAQGVSAVYACVQAISETTASLPLILFRRDGDDRERASDHPLYRVLHDIANPQQTALEFREYMQASVLLRGNAFARIVRGYDGQVRELWPLAPDRVSVLRVGESLGYEYTDRKGIVHRLLADEVLHLRHRLDDDGALGISPIAAARGVVELALSESEHGVNTFRNGAKLLGVLKFPGTLKKEQREVLRQSWSSQHGGGANSGKTAILEEGVDFQSVSMTLEDAEWIASRQFSVEEVARLFRVPPTIIGDLRHGNYSNSVELARQFVTMSLRRHLVAWEQSIAKQLLTEAGRRIYFAEHAVEGLLRGDATNRADFYDKGISSGWLLKSEARRLENLPTIQGIDDVKADDAQASPDDAARPPAGSQAQQGRQPQRA
ncbi:phage portal protein, HK97 family [Variovorax sp. PBL-H6]|uniref:phage portal protein n=1 Tax=Variovorax sp. PBL-H6 TaxID=434009 RepID=UPI001318E83E|nr:phage portal protein [Variovorax sp. PBL-H6]VTU29716.1 phage portal protein, HK97 family [Variovorax sp. PBL-H6]